MKYIYNTNNQVCTQSIELEVDNNTVKNVNFVGGCHGNHRGIASLVAGMSVDEVIRRLSGITCGLRATSCPDQLAQALEQIQSESK